MALSWSAKIACLDLVLPLSRSLQLLFDGTEVINRIQRPFYSTSGSSISSTAGAKASRNRKRAVNAALPPNSISAPLPPYSRDGHGPKRPAWLTISDSFSLIWDWRLGRDGARRRSRAAPRSDVASSMSRAAQDGLASRVLLADVSQNIPELV